MVGGKFIEVCFYLGLRVLVFVNRDRIEVMDINNGLAFISLRIWERRDLVFWVVGIIGLVFYIYVLSGSEGGSKKKMHRSYWGGAVEERNAAKRAKAQIAKPKRNSVALYVGIHPERLYKKLFSLASTLVMKKRSRQSVDEELLSSLLNSLRIVRSNLNKNYQRRRDAKRLYLPDVQRGTAVCGAPGSGKTYSIIDPVLRSAIEQGHPTVLYDFKYPDQASLLVPFALLHGYQIHIFAPGYDESDICNPLYFLQHVLDAETARQTGAVMNKNFNLGDAKGDKFFDTAADQLTEATFMIVRAFRECDLLSCQAFISLPNLVPRIKAWAQRSCEQDLACLFLGNKSKEVISLIHLISADPEIMSEFDYIIEMENGEVEKFNLIRELDLFLRCYILDFEKAGNEFVSDSINIDSFLYHIASNKNNHKFLQNSLPASIAVKGKGILSSTEVARDALYFLLSCFQSLYDKSSHYVVLFNELIKNKSFKFDYFTENSYRSLLSYFLDSITYFINAHPDYNPGKGSLRTYELKPWIKAAFSQLISTEKSERTLSSIISVTSNNLTRFVKPNIARHFVGQSTVPLYLEGKHLLVFGLDRERRDTVGPLMATVLHLLVNYNLTFKKDGQRRKHPLIVSLDELPTIYLPALTQWLNENRSDGFCGVIGFQNINQIQQAYGDKISRAILTGCNAKFIFNPGEPESAELFSKMLGEESYDTKQRSRSSGKGGGSVSVSDQEKGRKLFEPAQFLRLPQGSCIFLSPGYSNKKEANIPMFRVVDVPRSECELVEALLPLWERFRIARIKALGGDQLQDDRLHLDRRYSFIESLFIEVKDPFQTSQDFGD